MSQSGCSLHQYRNVHPVLTLACGFSVLVTSSLAVAQEKPAKASYSPFSVSVSRVSTQPAELGDGTGELQRDNWLIGGKANFRLNRQWAVGLNVGYDKLDYDWTVISPNSSDLFPNGQTWSNIDRYRAGVSLTYRPDKHWMFMLAPQVQYAYADTASSKNAQSYGAVASAMYLFDTGNLLGFGVVYLNDIEEVRTVPYLAIRWQLSGHWQIANPFQAGFSGPAGLELSYQINHDWDVGVGGAKRTQRFLLADDDLSVEIDEWASFVRGGWQVTDALSMNGYVGYFFDGSLELSQQLGTEKISNQGAAALAIEFKF